MTEDIHHRRRHGEHGGGMEESIQLSVPPLCSAVSAIVDSFNYARSHTSASVSMKI
jgi:hypothetical protein